MRYHDQEYVKTMVFLLNQEPFAVKKAIIMSLKTCYRKALIKRTKDLLCVDGVNPYVAPEDYDTFFAIQKTSKDKTIDDLKTYYKNHLTELHKNPDYYDKAIESIKINESCLYYEDLFELLGIQIPEF